MYLETNVGQTLPKVIEAFEALNKIAKDAQANVASLGSALRGVGRAAAGISTLAAAMERLDRAQERAATSASKLNQSVTNIPSGGAAGSVAAATAVNNAAARAARSGSSGGGATPLLLPAPGGALTAGGGGALVPPAGGGGSGPIPLNFGPSRTPVPRPSDGDLMQAGLGFGMVGAAILDFVKNAIEARGEIQHLQSSLQTMGFTAQQSNQALNEAVRLQQSVPGMSVGGGMEIIKDMMTITQSPSEALNFGAISSLARMGVVLGAAGKGDAMGALFKAMQAGELRGALSGANGELDVGKFQQFLKNVEVTTTVTGGRVGPAEILQYLKSSNAAGAMLTNPALFADSIMTILSMGSAKAGTALQGLSMQFASGKMSDGAANMLLEGGMLNLRPIDDADRAYYAKHHTYPQLRDYKVGIGQFRFPQNVLPNARQAQQNPFQFIHDTLLPFIDRYDAAHGGIATDPDALMAQRMATAQQLASRIPGGALIGDVIRNYLLVQRDREAIAHGQDRDTYDIRQATDPNIKFQALQQSLNALLVSLGGPIMDSAIKGINELTSIMNTLSNWAQAHPETAGRVMQTAAALGALSAAVGIASLTLGFASPMMRTFKWLASAEGALAGTNVAKFGTAISGVASIALAAVAALGASALLKGAFNAAGSAAEDAIFGPDKAQAARDVRSRVQAGVDSFSMWDRSTWSDPNAHWWNMSPRIPSSSQPVQMQGNVNLDGRKVGNFVAGSVANQAARPPSGQTPFDPRMTPMPTGATP